MRIVIDLDGVICNLKKENENYSEVKPNFKAVDKIKNLKEEGHYIIIYTARHMKSTNSNLGLLNKKIGKITLDWLEKYQIPYDEIYFGKPYGDVYIDDSAIEFKSWNSISPDYLDQKKVNIVIPMAGKGSRFLEKGFETPKPLIKAKNKEMFRWATESFSNIENKRFIFIVLKEHVESHQIDKIIKQYYPSSEIVILNEITRGQSETVLKSKKYIDNYNKLIIFNADTFFKSNNLNSILENEKIEGAVACFKDLTGSEKYSFAKVDNYSNVLEVAEKKRISDFASNGMYYFKQGKDFVYVAEKQIADNKTQKGEYYVMPVYQDFIKNGKRVKMFIVDENHVLGTPEELKIFEAI